MKFEKQLNYLKGVAVKIGKRNFIIIGSVLLIGITVCLNFMLFTGEKEPAPVLDLTNTPISAEGEDGGGDDYFAMTEISRQRARDEAIDVLQTVVDSEDALAEAKDAALAEISAIALQIESEANIEMLIKSKGFEDCVAVISGDNASVVVRSDGLLPTDIAQITEIVYQQAGISPTNLNIIQKSE
ncbi:MAG: SpoIIIAH-like family protein [Clostridia bacterium]|nr:SpoIIIAH-like family protein [Clostridia bacterium]